MVGCGLLALVQAADRFDPSLGVPFGAWAQIRIDGAITDGLRTKDPLTVAARSVHRRIRTAHDDLRDSATHNPDDRSVAASAGITLDDLRHTLQLVAESQPVALEVAEQQALVPAASDPETQPERTTLHRCMVARINEMIERLSEFQREALVGTFLDGRTGVEVAESLGVSGARVSQLRNEALTLLREWIDTEPA